MRLFIPCLLALLAMVNSPAEAAGSVPVLLELFGSEGCSSCPPADDYLHELMHKQAIPGVRLIAMAEHVDYWDDLGWKDPFASPAFTATQKGLVQALHLPGGLYTPMLVVDGAVACVGSDRPAVLKAIKAAAQRPHAQLLLSFIGPFLQAKGAQASVTIQSVPPGWGQRLATLEATALRDTVTSHVGSGENAGKVLVHEFVAITTTRTTVDLRRLGHATQIGPITLAPGGGRVVVVLRSLDETQVLGSVAASWPPHEGAAPVER
jgi:hypothetical protein